MPLEPPVTTLRFSGPYEEKDGKYYVLPETQIFFLAEDASPVGTYYSLDGAPDFTPALPFTIPDAGDGPGREDPLVQAVRDRVRSANRGVLCPGGVLSGLILDR